MVRRLVARLLVGIAIVGMGASAALAADPLDVAPDMYKKLFENEKVRVMEVQFAPGQAIPEHSHPDHFVYVLQPGQLRISKPDGSATDADLQPGAVVWMSAETHSAVNTGATPVDLLVVEIKP